MEGPRIAPAESVSRHWLVVRSMHGFLIESRGIEAGFDLVRVFIEAIRVWMNAGWHIGDFSSTTGAFFCDRGRPVDPRGTSGGLRRHVLCGGGSLGSLVVCPAEALHLELKEETGRYASPLGAKAAGSTARYLNLLPLDRPPPAPPPCVRPAARLVGLNPCVCSLCANSASRSYASLVYSSVASKSGSSPT